MISRDLLCVSVLAVGIWLNPAGLSAQDWRLGERELEKLSKQEARASHRLLRGSWQAARDTSGYDVHYYGLYLNLLVAQEQIQGRVTMEARVTADSLQQVRLDLQDSMTVDSVVVAGRRTGFAHFRDVLQMDLDRVYRKGDEIAVQVHYHGTPQSSGFGPFGFDTYHGQPMIWSLSEPFGARNWWPCKDIPADKADSVDVRIEVPNGLMAVSNGLLRGVADAGGREVFWWHEAYPITTYLVSIAVHPFVHFADSVEVVPGVITPVDYYVFPSQLERSREAYASTPQMILTYSRLFGPYPFYREKYGHAQFLGGANMEHQTITSLRSFSELTIAHELAHQWWGDMITCRDFHHIWLNEGFATYSEALWVEQTYGKEDYHQLMNDRAYFGPGTIFVPVTSSVERIFDYDLSYKKGAWVLHMLRHAVGDSVFFRILKTYGDDPSLKYGTAVTEDFQRVCEAVSGMDLSDFFHQWIYEPYYPRYVLSYSVREGGGQFQTEVTIRQEQQNTVVFHMPVDLRFTFASGDTLIRVDDRDRQQVFRFTFRDRPVAVELDPDNWILKEVREEQTSVAAAPVPEGFALRGAFPNPFRSGTEVRFVLNQAGQVTASLFDLRGREVRRWNPGLLEPGRHSLHWDGRDGGGRLLPSGLYFLTVTAGHHRGQVKLLLIR